MSTQQADHRWYAVQTRSNFEKQVTTQLAAKGIENYWPAIEEERQWADRKKVIERAVFPGYLFARIKDDSSTRLTIHKANGVVRILGFSDRIEPVPEHEVEAIRTLLTSGQRCFPHPFLSEGSSVRVTRGPLRGVEGKLVRVKNESRLVLSVELLSQAVATEVGLYDVEVIRTSALCARA